MLQSIFNKVAGLKACNFIRKRFQHGCFPVNIAKVLRKDSFLNTSSAAFIKESPFKANINQFKVNVVIT